MAVLGKCLIEISVENRETLISMGAKARSKSYDVVLKEVFQEHKELKQTNKKLQNQNDELQGAIIKISLANGDQK